MEPTNPKLSGALPVDECISRAHLALAYLRQRLAQHPEPDVVASATRRIRAMAISLFEMAQAAAEDLDQELPADLARLEGLAPERPVESMENQPLEDPAVFFKVWVEIERIDENANHYENMSRNELIGPKSVGTFTSLRQALEQTLSLQGVYGGLTLHPTDFSELERAEKLELIASGEAGEDVVVTIGGDAPPAAERWTPPAPEEGDDAYVTDLPTATEEEDECGSVEVPALTGGEDG